jgi:hypothetical protein
MKKIFALAVALLAIGMTVAPLAQAQTAAQQRELEQIAKRSVNGLSPQDRKRTVEIMTDVYVKQGMSKQQAASLAEMAANSMFTNDVGGMTSEQQRQFAEQNQAIDDFEQRQRQPQQQQQAAQPGDNAGWPSAAWFRQYGHEKLNMNQPAGTEASYASYDTLIFLTGGNTTTVIQGLVSQLEKTHKVKATVNDGRYTIRYAPDRYGNGPYVSISQENGVVRIYLGHSGG